MGWDFNPRHAGDAPAQLPFLIAFGKQSITTKELRHICAAEPQARAHARET